MFRRKNPLFDLIFIFILVPIFVFAFMLIFQRNFIYQPSKKISKTPEDIGLKYENVFFETSDGVKLNGWYLCPLKPRGETILFCHGNAENLSHYLDEIKQFYDIGFCVLAFDYRGFGLSEGEISEEGTYIDADAAWNYLVKVKKVLPEKIIIVGRSLGGPIAAYLALKHHPRALFLEATFTSIKDIAKMKYPFLPAKFLKYNYNTLSYIKKVRAPVLIVHSIDDRKVPFHLAQKLFETANHPKKFVKITGPHKKGFLQKQNHELYKKEVISFLALTAD
ncbi:MAG: alpha/beta hydrolase [Elusimicrobia bacterium]|nr:alpha/beta hydrolase [Elusimicrobiota bacterium]